MTKSCLSDSFLCVWQMSFIIPAHGLKMDRESNKNKAGSSQGVRTFIQSEQNAILGERLSKKRKICWIAFTNDLNDSRLQYCSDSYRRITL